jgi:hypothetical protein
MRVAVWRSVFSRATLLSFPLVFSYEQAISAHGRLLWSTEAVFAFLLLSTLLTPLNGREGAFYHDLINSQRQTAAAARDRCAASMIWIRHRRQALMPAGRTAKDAAETVVALPRLRSRFHIHEEVAG